LEEAVIGSRHATIAVPHRPLLLAAALIATFIRAVESAIVAAAIPTIVGELGGFRLFS
jgi:hypothetical protein